MLSGLEVLKFRSFKSLQVEHLRRVNLFVGANNAGKTSLLEAVELLSGGSPIDLWRGPSRRGEDIVLPEEDRRPPLRQMDLSHLFHGHVLQGNSFHLRGQDLRPRFVECSVVPSAPESEESVAQGDLLQEEQVGPALAIRFRSDSISDSVTIKLSSLFGVSLEALRRSSFQPGERLPAGIPNSFIRPESFEPSRLGALWDRVVLTSEELEVIRALRIIEPAIERIAFLGDERRISRGVLLKFANSDLRVPIGSVGDGLKRLLALSLTLISARGGVLLVDEIDTGLHFSVMADMWKVVIETAKRQNVQVFSTTHSLDCVSALAGLRHGFERYDEDVALYRIEKGMESTVRFSLRDLEVAARSHLEVR